MVSKIHKFINNDSHTSQQMSEWPRGCKTNHSAQDKGSKLLAIMIIFIFILFVISHFIWKKNV